MGTRPGVFRAVAAVSLFVLGCQGGRSLGGSGQGGSGGETQSSGGTGSGDHDGGLGGIAGAGGSPDASGTGACTPLGATPRRLWRLSAEQWGNAVQSLLSLPAPPVLVSRGGEAAFAAFADSSLGVDSEMLFDMYNLLGTATDQIDPMVANAIAPCAGTTADAQTGCATTFVQVFVKWAYRRPVADDELSDLMAVYQQGATTSYNAGIELVMKAVLASPSFVFRTELGPPMLTADAQGNYPDTTLTPYEVASQLSFTLTGNLPDAPLMAAAADGSLATTAGVTAQVDRLLALPAAQSYLTDVVLNWMGIGLVFAKTKDAALLSPAATGSDQDQTAIRNDLWTSGRQFVSSILWSGSGQIDDLLTSQTFYVNTRLAKLYPDAVVAAPPANDTTFVAATWPASERRSGLLTQPSYLWAVSDPSLTSIVKRGKELHDDVLCQDLIGAPIDLSTPQAQNAIACKSLDGTHTLSTCDSEVLKADARLALQPCQVCHAQMDPYALVLQNFGPIGNYRTIDEAGRPIDATATFVPTQPPVLVDTGFNQPPISVSVPGSPLGPRTVTGAQAFASALISTGVFRGCAAERLLGTALGRWIQTYDTCELGPIRAASDGTIKSLFVNLLSPDFMRARTGGPK
jgi:hypothetical protein